MAELADLVRADHESFSQIMKKQGWHELTSEECDRVMLVARTFIGAAFVDAV